MDQIERRRALLIGLAALQDFADQARREPLAGTIQLRALLALLAVHGKGDTEVYRRFWQIARQPVDPSNPYAHQDYQRGTYTQIQWVGIARDLGFPAVHTEFCQRVQEMVKRARTTRVTPSQ